MHILPVEILHLIFSHLPKNDLSQCQTTCKSWYRPAQRYFYKNVFLKYQAQAEKYIETITSFQELGQFAESIDLNHVFLPRFYAASPDRYKILSRLAELCPNVRYLNTSDTNNDFFKNLLPVYRKGHFQYLENIPVPKGWAVFKDYVQCVMAMHESLTRLTIGDATNRHCYFDDIFQDDYMDEMTSQLDKFTHLKSLSFIKHTDSYIFEFDDIIQKCPQLDSFSFTAYSLKRIASEGLFDYLGDDVYTKVDLKQIQPRSNIRSFMGNFLLMSDESFKYIMFKFPQLEYLEINTNDQDYQLIADIKTRGFDFSPEIMMKFLRYISQMKTARFHNVYMPNSVDFLSNLLNTMNFNGAIEIKYKIEHHSSISADNPMLHFDSGSNHQSCWDANKITAVFERAKQHDKALVREQEANNLPHTAILSTSGKRIRHLIMNNVNKKVTQDFDTNGACVFDSILHCCPLLKSIAMVDCSFTDYYSFASCKAKNNSIERLAMQQCQLAEQDLTKISINMPLLKHVNLIDCVFTGTGSVPRIMMIDMPSTSFETLVYTDISNSGPVSKIYLQVTTLAAASLYYIGHNSNFTCSTFDEYYESLALNEKTFLRLNICCKSIKTLSIGFDDNHVSSCWIDK